MSKKDSTYIGNIYDPKFVMPEVKESLQEKPVDFRKQDPTYIGNIYDPDFEWQGEKAEKSKYEKVMEGLKTERKPYSVPFKMPQKEAQNTVKLIDEEIKATRRRLAEARAEVDKRNTLGKMLGFGPEREYVKTLEGELDKLDQRKKDLIAEDKDITEVDQQISRIHREIEDINNKLSSVRSKSVRGYKGLDVISNKFGGAYLSGPAANMDNRHLTSQLDILKGKENELQAKRKQLEYAATPLDPKEVQEIENNIGQYSGVIKNRDIYDKYGADKVERALREVYNFAYNDRTDQHVKELQKREDYQSLLSAEYMIYQNRGGDAPKITEGQQQEVEKLYNETIKTKEYKEAGFIQRRRIMHKALKDHLTLKHKEVAVVSDKSPLAKDLVDQDLKPMTAYLAQRMMLNDKGDNISLQGLQMMTEYINGDLVDRKIELETQRKATWQANNYSNSGADMEERARLDAKYGAANVTLYFKQLDDEYKLINDALEFNKKILDMNPQESWLRQYQTGMTSTPTQDLLTAGITEMTRMLRINETANKGVNGELTWTEAKVLETYALMNMANNSGEMSMAYRVGTQVGAMIPYVASFIATNPVYMAGKAATKGATRMAARTVKKSLQREIIASTKIPLKPGLAKIYGKKAVSPIEMAVRMIERTGGVTAQTFASQPMLQTALARETMPKIQATFNLEYNDMFIKIEGQSPEELRESRKKAWIGSFSEIFTERMGAYIMKGGRMAGNISGIEAIKRYNLSKYIGLKQAANPNKKISSFVRRGMGWDGIAEEYYEELANYFMANVLTGEKPIQEGFLQQQVETLATVAIFGAAMKGANIFEDIEVIRYGDNVRYSFKDSKGKKQKVVLPGYLNQDLKDIFETEESFTDPVLGLLDTYGKDLSEKQVAFIMRLTGMKQAEKIIDDIRKRSSPYPDLAKAGDIIEGEEQISSPYPDLATAGDDLAATGGILKGLQKTDKKGRVHIYRQKIKDKGQGVTEIKYEFNRSDKPKDQWNAASIPFTETEYYKDYELDFDFDESLTVDDDAIRVRAIRLKDNVPVAGDFVLQRKEGDVDVTLSLKKRISNITEKIQKSGGGDDSNKKKSLAETVPGTLAFEGTAEEDLAKREFKTYEEKYNQPPEGLPPERMNEWISEESNNPSEIHLAWQEESEKTEEAELSPLEEFVLGQKITPQSWKRFSDQNKTSGSIGQTWLNKGKGRSLDDLRDEAASMEGIPEDITIDDIIEIMFKFPGNRARKTSPLQLDLERRYREVTGRNIQDHRELNVKEQETLTAGEELFEEEVTEGAEGEVELTQEEENAIEKHNEKIIRAYPDLAEAGLLTRTASGQLERPTYEELLDHAERLSGELQEITSTDNLGQVVMRGDRALSMLRQFEVLNREINKRAETEAIPFKYLMPSEKHERLSQEIIEGKKKKGTLTRKSNNILTLHLENGEQVDVVIPPNEENKKKAEEAILSQQEVSLRHVEKKNKLAVMYQGKELGKIQAHNFQYARDLEQKSAELGSYIDEEIEMAKRLFLKASGTMASGIPLTPDHIEALKHVVKLVKYLVQKGLTDARIIAEKIKERIRASNKIDTDQKMYWTNLINDNIGLIHQTVKEALAAELKQFDPKQLEIAFDNPDVAFLSGEQKKEIHLKTFNNIWTPVAEFAAVSKAEVERYFYSMAQDAAFKDVSNDATYQAFLQTYASEEPMVKALIGFLATRPFNEIVSAFNFYSNARITRQLGILIQDDGSVAIKTLNPSENYSDFINKFHSAINNYTYKKKKGYDAIRSEIQDHAREAKKLQNSIQNMEKEDRIAARKEQHQKDLELLAKITGLTPEKWNEFFEDKVGKVRTAHMSREDRKITKTFDTYQELLEEDTYAWSKKYKYGFRRVQSDMVAALQFMADRADTLEKFKQGLHTHFLRGKDKALSNLYQLLTANETRDDLGLSGIDVKTDRFNSFIQYSHAFATAEALGKEIIILNGLHNKKENKDQKGSEAAKMSVDDIWFSLAHIYAQKPDIYFQHMGQFGDKASLMLIEQEKHTNLTEEDFESMRKTFPDFDAAVDFFFRRIVIPNGNTFLEMKDGREVGPAAGYEGKNMAEKRENFAKEFVYNYAMAMPEINMQFHGEISHYEKGLIDVFKRGGSTNSPGYRLNENIEGGVGKSYRVLIVDDSNLMKPLKKGERKRKTWREPDGLSVGSDNFFSKIAVSMGEIYSQTKKHGFLTSVKALHSNVVNGKRGLMKTNNINIRALAMKHKSIYQQLDAYMAKHKIDMITFTSGNKLTEVDGYKPISLFDKNGKFQDVSPKGKIIERNTSDLFIQQDLRHSTTPKATKMPSQTMANAITLPNGSTIAKLAYQIQEAALTELETMIREMGSDNVRLEWIKEAINPYNHPDLVRMLEAGIGINEPSIRKLVRTILSSQVSRKALEIPINRVTSQEIPDIDGVLKGRREFEGHVLLPDIAANITGVRAEWTNNGEFLGKPDLAISHVIANKNQYPDLFDRDGNLMEWEIRGRNGAIPGEPIVSTRVPADDLHSHTVARLKFNIGSRDEFSGNFTMLDNDSRVASGSDFDGDARFNQVFFKNPDGYIFLDNTKEGLSNQMLMEMVYGYSDPAMTERINTQVDPDAYNDIVEKQREKDTAWNESDLRAYMEAWERNKVGVDMKGILTDMNTLFSLASNYQIDLKGEIYNPATRKGLSKFINDEYGQMKRHIANLLNMAFDNAKDPKIEIMGLNEITVNMFMLGLMTNPELESGKFKSAEEHYEAIYKAIEAQVKYFTSPMMKYFTMLMRRQNGGLMRKDTRKVWDRMNKKFKGEEKELKKFFSLSQDLPEIRNFYRLTQSVPKSSTELEMAFQILDKMRRNDFDLFDSSRLFFNGTKKLKTEFAIIPRELSFMWEKIFFDSIESTETGRDIIEYIIAKIEEYYRDPAQKGKDFELDDLKRSQYESISYLMNNIVSVLAVNKNKSYIQVRKEAIDAFYQYQTTGNLFLQYLQVIPRPEGPSLEIIPEFRYAAIPEEDLPKIHEAFDMLPQDVKDKIIAYNFHRFGITSSRMGGGFYSLVSDKEKKKIAEKNQQEIDNWDMGTLTPEQQYNIAKLIIFASKDPDIKNLWGENKHAAMNYNVNVADPYSGIPLDYEALESVQGAIDKQSIKEWIEEYGLPGFTSKEFGGLIKEGLEMDPNYGISFPKDIIPWAKKILEARDNEINYFKNANEQISDEDLKEMVAQDVVGEALASDDPAIQEFILERMQQMYPEVEFFKSKDAFFSFLRKNGARFHNVSPSAIGHALGNAVYADPQEAVQSTILHEYAHIYWDALPADHYAKTQLLRLFRTLPGNENLPEDRIEEQIIIAIGRSAFNIAEAEYPKSFTEKFAQALKKFWAAVKRILGKTDRKQELVDEMAYALWTNQDQIKAQTVTGQATIKSMAEPSMDSYLNEGKNQYIIGGKVFNRVSVVSDFAKVSPFNAVARAERIIEREAREYRQKHGMEMPDTDRITKRVELEQKWERENKAGQLIKAIAEEVFGGEKVSAEQVKSMFKSQEAYHSLVKSINRLKKALLEKYPGATFETSVITFTEKYRIAGRISLRVKVGENQYVIINFKTTKFAYRDKSGELTQEYTRSWGELNPPFPEEAEDSKQMENFIQTGLYAAMEEGKGREIVEVLIVPIIRSMNEEGMIDGAYIANRIEDNPLANTVKVPWRDSKGKVHTRNRDLLRKLAEAFKKNQDGLKSKPISDKEAMVKNDITPEVAEAQLAAEEFLSGFYDFENINYRDIERMAHFGLHDIVSRLHELGYSRTDLKGPQAIDMKYLFFLAHYDIKKSEWESAKHTEDRTGKNPLVSKIETGVRFVPKLNPSHKGRTKYHLQVAGRDLYMEEAGHDTLKKGDEIVQIITEKDDSGQIMRRAYHYVVISTNPRNKTIRVLNPNSIKAEEEILDLNSAEGKAGTMKLINQDDSIPKNSYEPKYIKERDQLTENQYKRESRKSFENDEDYENYLKRIRIVDKFFNRNKTIEDLRESFSNKDEIERLYQNVHYSEGDQLNWFAQLLGQVLTAHYMADQIRYEAKYMKKHQAKPAILSIYFMLNSDAESKKSMYDFKNPYLTKMFLPDRVIGGNHVPMHFIRRGVVEAYQEAMTAQITLRELVKPFLGKIDYDRIVETVYESEYYRHPNTPGLTKEEKEFLSIVYEYRYKYDPKFKRIKRTGATYPRQVPVSKMFATKGEMVTRFGRKYGGILKELLTPATYDDMELDEIIINEFGKYEKTGRKTTLGKAKETFAYLTGSDTHNRQWLGTKWRHFISKAVGENTMSPGILKHYQRIARKKYDSVKNQDPELLRKRSMIPLSGRGNPKYTSNYFTEAEAKSIEGLIFEHHMSPVIAPADHIMAHLKGKTNVAEWLKIYMDKIVYREPVDEVPEGVRRFVNYLVRLNSLVKMAFQLRVQAKNFGIGVGMNITRETVPYVKSIREGTATLIGIVVGKKPEGKLRKVIAIMKKTNLIMHMADDPMFDKLEKMMVKKNPVTGKPITQLPLWERFIRGGYAPMTFFENMIQIPLLLGMLTEEELNSYDMEGNVIDEMNKITYARMHELREALRSVHGDYGPLNAAQFWQTTWGELFFQFRKWGTAMFDKEFGIYQLDSNYKVRSGIFRTVELLLRTHYWNRKDETERKVKYRKMLADYKNKNISDKVFFRGTQEYLERLIIAQEGGKVTMKNLSKADQWKLIAATVQLSSIMLHILRNMLAEAMGDGDDDDNIKIDKPLKSRMLQRQRYLADWWAKYLMRYGSDIYFFMAADQWDYVAKNPLPLTGLVANTVAFAVQFTGWIGGLIADSEIKMFGEDKVFDIHTNHAVYEKDSRYARKGWPKWIISALGSLPAGSQIRSMMENTFYVLSVIPKYDIQALFSASGIYQEVIDETIERMGRPKLSEFEIRFWSEWWAQFNKDLKEGEKALAIKAELEKQGLPSTPYHIQKIIRTLDTIDLNTKQRKKLVKAIEGLSFYEQLQQGNFTPEEMDSIQAMIEAAKEQKKEKKIKTNKGLQRELEKTMPVLEQLVD
jgi:hypothetical protein